METNQCHRFLRHKGLDRAQPPAYLQGPWVAFAHQVLELAVRVDGQEERCADGGCGFPSGNHICPGDPPTLFRPVFNKVPGGFHPRLQEPRMAEALHAAAPRAAVTEGALPVHGRAATYPSSPHPPRLGQCARADAWRNQSLRSRSTEGRTFSAAKRPALGRSGATERRALVDATHFKVDDRAPRSPCPLTSASTPRAGAGFIARMWVR